MWSHFLRLFRGPSLLLALPSAEGTLRVGRSACPHQDLHGAFPAVSLKFLGLEEEKGCRNVRHILLTRLTIDGLGIELPGPSCPAPSPLPRPRSREKVPSPARAEGLEGEVPPT